MSCGAPPATHTEFKAALVAGERVEHRRLDDVVVVARLGRGVVKRRGARRDRTAKTMLVTLPTA